MHVRITDLFDDENYQRGRRINCSCGWFADIYGVDQIQQGQNVIETHITEAHSKVRDNLDHRQPNFD